MDNNAQLRTELYGLFCQNLGLVAFKAVFEEKPIGVVEEIVAMISHELEEAYLEQLRDMEAPSGIIGDFAEMIGHDHGEYVNSMSVTVKKTCKEISDMVIGGFRDDPEP